MMLEFAQGFMQLGDSTPIEVSNIRLHVEYGVIVPKPPHVLDWRPGIAPGREPDCYTPSTFIFDPLSVTP